MRLTIVECARQPVTVDFFFRKLLLMAMRHKWPHWQSPATSEGEAIMMSWRDRWCMRSWLCCDLRRFKWKKCSFQGSSSINSKWPSNSESANCPSAGHDFPPKKRQVPYRENTTNSKQAKSGPKSYGNWSMPTWMRAQGEKVLICFDNTVGAVPTNNTTLFRSTNIWQFN